MFLNIKFNNRFRHDCDLPKDKWEPTLQSPFDNWFKKLLRHIQYNTTLHPAMPDTRRYFRSTAAFKRELHRHRFAGKYKYIIHPFSVCHMGRRACVSLIWMFLLISEPLASSFMANLYMPVALTVCHWLFFIGNVILLCDIIQRFTLGYANDAVQEVILEPKLIARRYFLTYFFFDLIPILGNFAVTWIVRDIKLRLYVIQFHVFRLARLRTILKNVNYLLSVMGVIRPIRIGLNILTFTFCVIHNIACFMGWLYLVYEQRGIDRGDTFVGNYYQDIRQHDALKHINNFGMYEAYTVETCFRLYWNCFSTALTHFLGCGPFRFDSLDPIERFALSTLTIIGLCIYLCLLAVLLEMVQVHNIAHEKYEELILQTKEFMVRRHYPEDTMHRIQIYFDYKYGKSFFSEDHIKETLSPHLQLEVRLYSCRHLVSDFRNFKGLTKAAVGAILAHIKQEIFLTDDYILTAEHENDSLYFILYGTCAVYIHSGKELTHEEDGDKIGETSQYIPDAKVHFLYSVVALEPTEVYELTKADIFNCTKRYPELMERFEVLMKGQARVYNNLYALREQDENLTDEIVDQLRAKKILSKGAKRELFIADRK